MGLLQAARGADGREPRRSRAVPVSKSGERPSGGRRGGVAGMGGPGGKEACPPIPMTPPPSICLMQLLRKRATDIKRHSVPGGTTTRGGDRTLGTG